MDSVVLSEHVDLEHFDTLCNRTNARELIALYNQVLTDSLSDIVNKTKSNDFDSVNFIAHRIISGTKNLHFLIIINLLVDIELYAKHSDSPSILKAVSSIKESYDLIYPLLFQYMDDHEY